MGRSPGPKSSPHEPSISILIGRAPLPIRIYQPRSGPQSALAPCSSASALCLRVDHEYLHAASALLIGGGSQVPGLGS